MKKKKKLAAAEIESKNILAKSNKDVTEARDNIAIQLQKTQTMQNDLMHALTDPSSAHEPDAHLTNMQTSMFSEMGKTHRAMRRESDALQGQNELLQAQNASLQEELKRLHNAYQKEVMCVYIRDKSSKSTLWWYLRSHCLSSLSK